MTMNEQIFKGIMSHWATGISIITTKNEGTMKGFTANSFASVSVDPFLVSMSVAKSLSTLNDLLGSERFAINILTAEQQRWAEIFAGFHDVEDRFEGIDVINSALGNPILPDVLAWMDCRVYQTVDVGASILFLGEVRGGAVEKPDAMPLAYYHRQWGVFKSR
jgi:flavin reductase (DIM6/NTAB) family NADH-FMN oxidoreductase RutF